MFVNAIEIVIRFTRPIHSLIRNIDSEIIQKSTASLFFVNKDGWALTCKHVADLLYASINIKDRREKYNTELKTLQGTQKLSRIKKDLKKNMIILGIQFMNCTIDSLIVFRVI